MKNRFGPHNLSLALVGALSFYMVGCSKTEAPLTPPATSTTVGTEIDDSLLTARVKAALTDNKVSLKGAPTSIGTKVDDSVITTRVKTVLMADEGVKSADIAVVTRNGEVHLSGFVNNQGQIDRALEISGGVEGVTKVSNDMSIKK